MSCDRFGHCDNGTRVGVGVEIGVPIGQPGYNRQPEDPVRREAFHVAEELRRGMTGQALQEIRNDVYGMRPHEAERFNFALADACRQMGVRDPLRQAPEVRQDQYGRPFQTGNDVLLLSDPYRRTENVVKLIPHDRPMGPGPGGYTEIPPVVPVIPVQPHVGINIHIGKRF